jgi:uncharacterized repeat protein (TIGR03803 family)
MRSNKSRSAAKSVFAILLTFLLASMLAGQSAQAQKFKVLHTFNGTDGAEPLGFLRRDTNGNLYGTTATGGDGKGICGAVSFGCGTAFKLDAGGKLLWSHRFLFTDGMDPIGGLTRGSAGHFYGTTYLGGNTKCYEYGCGTVFELDKTGKKEKVLYRFAGNGGQGIFPEPLLARDTAGNLYGTTNGNIFKIDSSGNFSVLYTFGGKSDGCYPVGVILDTKGNLYGVATSGGAGPCGSGFGVVFEVDTSGNFSVLHTFGESDGAAPDSILVFDKAGNLYGTTYRGGTSGVCDGGCGTVFKMSPSGNGMWAESVLYNFCSLESCSDGQNPARGPLAIDAVGNLYGTTYFGGASQNCNEGCGAVYKLDPSGQETVLYNFTGENDGGFPYSGVVRDKTGNLYGVAAGFGDPNCPDGLGGCGVVFEITP